jgi:hypothetical protein
MTDGETCKADPPSRPGSPSTGGLGKAGARHGKEILAHLQAAHDHLVAAGGKCDAAGHADYGQDAANEDAEEEEQGTEFDPSTSSGGKAARGGNLAKRYDALAKAVADLTPRLDAIAKTVEQIKNTPLPPLTRSTAGLARVEKREDGAGGGAPSDEELMARIARMSPDEQAMLLIKAARLKPYRLGPGGPQPAETGHG